jgi:hypothetical protein
MSLPLPSAPLEARWPLRFAKLLLLVLVPAGIVVQGPWRHDLWPIVSVPVYSTYRPGIPSATFSQPMVEVTHLDGSQTWVNPVRLMGYERYAVYLRAVQNTRPVDDTPGAIAESLAYRRYLAWLVKRARPSLSDVAEVRVWNVTWDADPWATPPLNVATPRQRTLHAVFVLDGSGWPAVEEAQP